MAEMDLISQMFKTVVAAGKGSTSTPRAGKEEGKETGEKHYNVNSQNPQFFNLNVSESEITDWLSSIHNQTGIDDLSAALEVVYTQSMSRDQMRAACLTSEMIYQSANGNVQRPINPYERYSQIVNERANS